MTARSVLSTAAVEEVRTPPINLNPDSSGPSIAGLFPFSLVLLASIIEGESSPDYQRIMVGRMLLSFVFVNLNDSMYNLLIVWLPVAVVSSIDDRTRVSTLIN